ncbi:hypothetical protein [Ramlibacter sp.]|uniref:hypothetical protein n=1 Tax=Ramlibacter sp. TaxID=1917967 RepID=UPI003D0A9A09
MNRRPISFEFDAPAVDLVLQGLGELRSRVDTTMNAIAQGAAQQLRAQQESEAAVVLPRKVSRRAVVPSACGRRSAA